jgi:hypothetical protein
MLARKDRITELLHSQQSLGLLRWTFAAQNRSPQVFNQSKPLLQELSTACFVAISPGLCALRNQG